MTSVTTKTEEAATGNWISRAQTFVAEVRAESKKVTWPSRDEVRDNTIAVIITSIIIALFIFGVDQVMSLFIKAIL